jgi:hypothetical protein
LTFTQNNTSILHEVINSFGGSYLTSEDFTLNNRSECNSHESSVICRGLLSTHNHHNTFPAAFSGSNMLETEWVWTIWTLKNYFTPPSQCLNRWPSVLGKKSINSTIDKCWEEFGFHQGSIEGIADDSWFSVLQSLWSFTD